MPHNAQQWMIDQFTSQLESLCIAVELKDKVSVLKVGEELKGMFLMTLKAYLVSINEGGDRISRVESVEEIKTF